MFKNGSNRSQYISHSPVETQALGTHFALQLIPNTVVCFFGDLGAGKTTFIKGVAAGLSGASENEVNSPTFTYLNIYSGAITLYHFDLYRLRDADEFLSMGFDEMLFAGGVSCIEWSEKIAGLLPAEIISVRMTHLTKESRQIDIIFSG